MYVVQTGGCITNRTLFLKVNRSFILRGLSCRTELKLRCCTNKFRDAVIISCGKKENDLVLVELVGQWKDIAIAFSLSVGDNCNQHEFILESGNSKSDRFIFHSKHSKSYPDIHKKCGKPTNPICKACNTGIKGKIKKCNKCKGLLHNACCKRFSKEEAYKNGKSYSRVYSGCCEYETTGQAKKGIELPADKLFSFQFEKVAAENVAVNGSSQETPNMNESTSNDLETTHNNPTTNPENIAVNSQEAPKPTSYDWEITTPDKKFNITTDDPTLPWDIGPSLTPGLYTATLSSLANYTLIVPDLSFIGPITLTSYKWVFSEKMRASSVDCNLRCDIGTYLEPGVYTATLVVEGIKNIVAPYTFIAQYSVLGQRKREEISSNTGVTDKSHVREGEKLVTNKKSPVVMDTLASDVSIAKQEPQETSLLAINMEQLPLDNLKNNDSTAEKNVEEEVVEEISEIPAELLAYFEINSNEMDAFSDQNSTKTSEEASQCSKRTRDEDNEKSTKAQKL